MSKIGKEKIAISNEIARYESSINYFREKLADEHKGENAIIAKIAQAKEDLSEIHPDCEQYVAKRAYLIARIECLNCSLATAKENIDHIEDAIFALNTIIDSLRKKLLYM